MRLGEAFDQGLPILIVQVDVMSHYLTEGSDGGLDPLHHRPRADIDQAERSKPFTQLVGVDQIDRAYLDTNGRPLVDQFSEMSWTLGPPHDRRASRQQCDQLGHPIQERVETLVPGTGEADEWPRGGWAAGLGASKSDMSRARRAASNAVRSWSSRSRAARTVEGPSGAPPSGTDGR